MLTFKAFDSCSQPLGPLRQSLFACITCNPPPTGSEDKFTPAAVCYSCSISCHGEHTLVELFNRRNFVCDCGTTRLPSSAPCTLRNDPGTGAKGVHSQEPASGNAYNHNFQNKFCGCGEVYDAYKEKGTMFQCLGLGTVETGGCGEDWWHPECLINLPRDWNKTETAGKEKKGEDSTKEEHTSAGDEGDETPLPPNFPGEDDFDTFICFKCIDSNPWLKRYAGTPGFLPPVYKHGGLAEISDNKPPQTSESPDGQQDGNKKRKADDNADEEAPAPKRTKEGENTESTDAEAKPEVPDAKQPTHKHESLPVSTPSGSFSLFLKEDFRDHFCRCPECYPNLAHHAQLREEEEAYEPPLSDDGESNGGDSAGTSLLDRGEAAFSNMDRVRAIEGAMVYNRLRDNLKGFLKPYAETGKAVSAEDIKEYFQTLRGDDQAIRNAAGQASAASNGDSNGDGDGDGDGGNRREQSGMCC